MPLAVGPIACFPDMAILCQPNQGSRAYRQVRFRCVDVLSNELLYRHVREGSKAWLAGRLRFA